MLLLSENRSWLPTPPGHHPCPLTRTSSLPLPSLTSPTSSLSSSPFPTLNLSVLPLKANSPQSSNSFYSPPSSPGLCCCNSPLSPIGLIFPHMHQTLFSSILQKSSSLSHFSTPLQNQNTQTLSTLAISRSIFSALLVGHHPHHSPELALVKTTINTHGANFSGRCSVLTSAASDPGFSPLLETLFSHLP